MFLQLAVSKQGIITGTLQNTVSGVVKTIEGMVDKETQRAAWTAEGETRPLMETRHRQLDARYRGHARSF